MINTFIFQPISVHMPYLYGVVADLVVAYKANALHPIDKIKQNYINSLDLQAESAKSKGATKFPVIVSIKGPIIKHSNWSYLGTQFYNQLVKELDANPQVSHIIFDIDSGGGMVSGTTEFSETIRNCQTLTVAYTNGMACSAAQQIFSAADVCVASPYADLLGSIGTLMSYQDFTAMFEKWGAKIYESYAPQSTEKNKAFRDWKAGDAKAIEEDLKQYADAFISTMKEYRGDKLKDDGKLFKGKTYRPQEAKEIGLVDEIMTMDELLTKL